MASKKTLSLAFFLSLNLLFFLLVSAWNECPPPEWKPKPTPKHKPRPKPKPKPQPTPSPCPCPPPSYGHPPSGPPPSGPPPSGPPPSGPPPSCPRDALKLGVCADLLKGLLNITIGTPPVTPCCSLIQGLADLEAALCLCTAIKGNLLGLNLNIPLSLSLLLNVCSKKVPPQFQCP